MPRVTARFRPTGRSTASSRPAPVARTVPYAHKVVYDATNHKSAFVSARALVHKVVELVTTGSTTNHVITESSMVAERTGLLYAGVLLLGPGARADDGFFSAMISTLDHETGAVGVFVAIGDLDMPASAAARLEPALGVTLDTLRALGCLRLPADRQLASVVPEEEQKLVDQLGLRNAPIPCFAIFTRGNQEPIYLPLHSQLWSTLERRDALAHVLCTSFSARRVVEAMNKRGESPADIKQALEGICAEARKGMTHFLSKTSRLDGTDLAILKFLVRQSGRKTTDDIARGIRRSVGSIGKNLAKLVKLELIENYPRRGYEIISLGRIRVGS